MPHQQSKTIDAARAAVHRALSHQAELFPELDLAPLDTSTLSPRDAAFAHAIYDTVLRRWITLAYLIDGYTSRGFGALDPRVRAVLLAGAAQLLLLDKVPPHAALNESVEWTKSTLPKAAGLVNAVLRRISELVHAQPSGLPEPRARTPWTDSRDLLPLPDGTAVQLRQPVLPQDPLERLEVASSCPLYLLRKWTTDFGDAQARNLALHALLSPPTILHTRFATAEVPHTQPHNDPAHRVYTGRREELTALLDDRPDLWVQDAASSRAVTTPLPRPPRLILDLCAGQGTKTRQFARTYPAARIIATDIDPRRLRALRHVAGREPTIEVIDPASTSTFRAQADLILLDVPCTNTGVLPRRVEARYRCGPAQLARLVATQRQILTDALSLLAPHGNILFSTCSLEPEENEQQLDWAKSLKLTASHIHRTMPSSLPGDPPSTYSDAAFSALLARA